MRKPIPLELSFAELRQDNTQVLNRPRTALGRHRATAGYCFSPLFGLFRTSQDFAALYAGQVKGRESKGDGGNSPCKTRFPKSPGFKSPLSARYSTTGLPAFVTLTVTLLYFPALTFPPAQYYLRGDAVWRRFQKLR
jgi:hypothetical protein